MYVLLGDGEVQEGQVWEAAMAAAQYRVASLTAIVDHNKAQQTDLVERVVDYRPLAAKWEAFSGMCKRWTATIKRPCGTPSPRRAMWPAGRR